MADEQPQSSNAEEESLDLQQEPSSPQQNQQKPDAKSQRKRTKTGCLTCRKRRIKCGEERPVCANCIKSKRNCEGYTQRVIFKHPLGGDYRAGQGYGPIRQDQSLPGLPAHASGSNGLTRIAPKGFPSPTDAYWDQHAVPQDPAQGHYSVNHSTSITGATDLPHILHPLNIPDPAVGYNYHFSGNGSLPNASQSHVPPSSGWHAMMPTTAGQSLSSDSFRMNTPSMPMLQQHESADHQSFVASSNENVFIPRMPSQMSTEPTTHALNDWPHVEPPTATSAGKDTYPMDLGGIIPSTQYIGSDFQYPSMGSTAEQVAGPLPEDTFLDDAVDEEDGDDPWDVTDEALESENTGVRPMEDMQLFSRVPFLPGDLELRGFKTFLNSPNVLARYRPTYASSPLTDEKTARIFAHFLTATGPSMSIFERNITNVGALFSGVTVPRSQQGLWTYILPSLALESTALMHAIIALGALHIAKLQETSLGSSIKHFQYALRRVGRLLGLPQRRNEIATVAANLILGFYEVMSAEHSKWSIHLAGAKILIMEMELASKTVCIRRARDQAKASIATMSPPPDMLYRDIWKHTGYSEELLDPLDWEIDDRFVSELSGLHVRFNELNEQIPMTLTMTEKEIHEYKIRSDLFWWYCKQDAFQSMISGNALLMPYEHWATNPPRSQFGRHDAPYGTFDHLTLLLARLTDWGAKDRRRKIKVMATNGGQWRPPPGFFPSRPTGKTGPAAAGPPPSARGPPGSRPAMPSFHGMMPPKPAHMESAYASVASNLQDPYRMETMGGVTNVGANEVPLHAVPPPSVDGIADSQQPMPANNPSESGPSLNELTEQALAEHASITRAFELFHASLPSTFAPLSPNQSPQIASPFGPAIQYRKHSIACIHLFYQCGLLLLARLHPHMPPATMAATFISASKTAGTAQIMGRIAGGLYHALNDETPRMATPNDRRFTTFADPFSIWGTGGEQQDDMNPMSGAALMESTFPMFFAGVQYTDPEQRSWTIRKLKAIARIAGWESSAAIAAGCETAWQRMGMSQGPTAGPSPPMPQGGSNDSGTVPGASMPGDAQSGIDQRPRMAHSNSAGASLSTPSNFSSSQFPIYVPTMSRNTNDDRVAGLFRDRERILRAQQHQLDQTQSQNYTKSDGTVTERRNSQVNAEHRAGPDSAVPTVSSSQPGQPAQYVTNQQDTHIQDEDADILPHDNTTPLPINHDRHLIGTHPNARVHWALGLLGLEKDLRHLDIN